ncbi:MAG: MBL fold metallo-hydrolase, partial [bacterium]
MEEKVAQVLKGITWLGHASFRIQSSSKVIYIDPWKLTPGV